MRPFADYGGRAAWGKVTRSIASSTHRLDAEPTDRSELLAHVAPPLKARGVEPRWKCGLRQSLRRSSTAWSNVTREQLAAAQAGIVGSQPEAGDGQAPPKIITEATVRTASEQGVAAAPTGIRNRAIVNRHVGLRAQGVGGMRPRPGDVLRRHAALRVRHGREIATARGVPLTQTALDRLGRVLGVRGRGGAWLSARWPAGTLSDRYVPRWWGGRGTCWGAETRDETRPRDARRQTPRRA